MAKEEKPKTEEEKAKEAEEARALNVKKTLESKLMQNTAGSNAVLTNQSLYGTLGVQSAQSAYDGTMSSDEAQKERYRGYQENVDEYRRNGVFGEPAYPSNGDLSNRLIRQLNEVMGLAKLSELEKISKGVGAKLNFEVPEELKEYSRNDLIKKAYDPEKGLDMNKFDDKEKHAFALYQVLSEAYNRACALKTAQSNLYGDLNEQGKRIADLYKKDEPKKA